ncbi:hypothetical protein GTY54_01965 [Streptomyces sp. SID625]|nr:hypothetical protein [Streptomyces sp. SID625]
MPRWLVLGLFVAVFPVFAVALVRGLTSGAGAQLLGPGHVHRFIGHVLLPPPVLKFAQASVICLTALGLAIGTAVLQAFSSCLVPATASAAAGRSRTAAERTYGS